VPIKAQKQHKCVSFQAIGARRWRLDTGGWGLGAGDSRKAEPDFLSRSAALIRTAGRAGRTSRLSELRDHADSRRLCRPDLRKASGFPAHATPPYPFEPSRGLEGP
jgi:hypothetical protein